MTFAFKGVTRKRLEVLFAQPSNGSFARASLTFAGKSATPIVLLTTAVRNGFAGAHGAFVSALNT